MTPPTPEISAVVVVGDRRERAGRCLAALLGQGVAVEVLLVDLASREDAAPVENAADPRVRRLRLGPESTFAAARAAGVAAAAAPIVAFVEEHVEVCPGWAAALVDAYQGPWAGVGTEIIAGNEHEGTAGVAALLSYGRWFPPAVGGEVEFLPGHNATFRTAVLRGLGPRLEELLEADLVLHRELRRAGHRLAIEPRARIAHWSETRWSSLARGVFWWYRLYGPMRARHDRWSLVRRLFYVVSTPLIPFYFAAHTARFLARHKPRYLGLFLRNPLYVLGIQLAGATGQAVGLLFGPADTALRFTRYELTEPRSLADWSDAP